MSALANGVGSSAVSSDTHTPSKSKKRKHEGELDRSSSKKHKHDKVREQTEPAAPVETAEEIELESSTGKKRRKEERRRRKAEKAARKEAEAARDWETNGDAPAERAGDEGVAGSVAEDVEPSIQPSSEKKRKKKRKGHEDGEREHTSDKPPADETGVLPATKPPRDADSDIDLPDAPPVAATSPSPPLDAPTNVEETLLYLPIPAIGLTTSNALSSVIAQHLSPLLLTYYRPANGIVLAFQDPVLSAHDGGLGLDGPMRPPSDESTVATSASGEVLARTADEFGVCWAWLTTTFLVFRPTPGEEMLGWTNVASEGLVGLVSYNMFQASVGKERIPEEWRWVGPGSDSTAHRKEPRKGKLGSPIKEDAPSQHNQAQADEDEAAAAASKVTRPRSEDDDKGHFLDTATNTRVPDTLTYKIVDVDLVPGHAHGTLTYQIDASLLDEAAEQRVNAEAKARWERQMKQRSSAGDVVMSGGLNS
ncbi:uncharacterized protein AB675_3950 [Cyphellophora attinorum]|uniref:RPA43 OB domain-containing protein n=1 Tax=Cyphellophora attinorum TaxID=1664694 RepID=A0A0N1H5A5_9EURO|nr:uncharacterized protein AB675_3950 [Phialophora attinorum]KPI37510.1 hypothetical protein AB675_3950 [Phialophora attinorum]